MPNNMPPLNEDVTIVGMGHISKNRKKPTKLQYAIVKQITANQCFKKAYPMKKIPENLSNVENQGFCVRGKNKELNLKMENLSLRLAYVEERRYM